MVTLLALHSPIVKQLVNNGFPFSEFRVRTSLSVEDTKIIPLFLLVNEITHKLTNDQWSFVRYLLLLKKIRVETF